MSRPYTSSSHALISSRPRRILGALGWEILLLIVTTASGAYIESCVAASRCSAARVKRSRSKVVMVPMAPSFEGGGTDPVPERSLVWCAPYLLVGKERLSNLPSSR